MLRIRTGSRANDRGGSPSRRSSASFAPGRVRYRAPMTSQASDWTPADAAGNVAGLAHDHRLQTASIRIWRMRGAPPDDRRRGGRGSRAPAARRRSSGTVIRTACCPRRSAIASLALISSGLACAIPSSPIDAGLPSAAALIPRPLRREMGRRSASGVCRDHDIRTALALVAWRTDVLSGLPARSGRRPSCSASAANRVSAGYRWCGRAGRFVSETASPSSSIAAAKPR